MKTITFYCFVLKGVEEIERKTAGHVRPQQPDALVHAHPLGTRRLYGAHSLRSEHVGFRQTDAHLSGDWYNSGEYFIRYD